MSRSVFAWLRRIKVGKGGQTNADEGWQEGEGGFRQMLTISDKGMGCLKTPLFGWRNVWTDPRRTHDHSHTLNPGQDKTHKKGISRAEGHQVWYMHSLCLDLVTWVTRSSEPSPILVARNLGNRQKSGPGSMGSRVQSEKLANERAGNFSARAPQNRSFSTVWEAMKVMAGLPED